jgi:hypothetical protein
MALESARVSDAAGRSCATRYKRALPTRGSTDSLLVSACSGKVRVYGQPGRRSVYPYGLG